MVSHTSFSQPLPRTYNSYFYDCSVHAWSYLAKKGFTSLIPLFKKIQLNIGFTIEGIADDELPECILGCAELSYLDVERLYCIPKELQCYN